MNFLETNVRGVLILVPIRHGDHRGFFAETYSQLAYAEHGGRCRFRPGQPLVIRGRGHSSRPALSGTASMLRPSWCAAGAGAIFDVAVDIRRGSPTYGRWAGYTLSAENGAQLFIPAALLMALPRLSPTARLSTNVAIITRQKPRARCVGMTRTLVSSGPSQAHRC